MRDDFPECPRGCGCALEPAAAILAGIRLVCPACGGTLVPERGLQELIAAMKLPDFVRAEIVPLPFSDLPVDRGDPALVCPRCTAAMQRRALFGVAVDCCDGHGIWLDADELSRVLDAAQ